MKKKIIWIFILILLIIAMGCFIFTLQKQDIRKINCTYEYGSEFTIHDIVKDDFKKSYKITSDEKGLISYFKNKKEYNIPVGDHSIIVEDANKKIQYDLHIVDITSPTFTRFSKTVEIGLDDSDIDWNLYFEGSDNDSFKLSVDDKKVKYGKPGKYTIQVCLEDASENTTKDTAKVIIGKTTSNIPKLEMEENSQATYVKGILIVNKHHSIPADFASGENPIAGNQVRKLIADMQALGYDISNDYSGYRSHQTQIGLYNSYVNSSGKEAADTFSARPGFSEHETGLTFDLKHTSGALVEGQKEAEWIAKNAHKYGFIVRYPQGKEDITGYIPEPWHLRYIGPEAKDIYESGLTLEEYLGLPSAPSYKE